MIGGDALGLLVVYSYIAVMVIVASKWHYLKKKGFHRKFIHIMIGNIALFWWIFDTNYVMALLAAAPFIPILLLFSIYGSEERSEKGVLTPSMKGSILNTASHDGHKLGLVYYAISWTLLAFLAFDDLLIASIGIVCMAYGDGMGGLIGKTYGRRRIHGRKTLEGTMAVFAFATLAIFLIINFYNLLYSADLYGTRSIATFTALPLSLGLGAYVAIVELYTPGEYDNLVIPLFTALIVFLLGV